MTYAFIALALVNAAVLYLGHRRAVLRRRRRDWPRFDYDMHGLTELRGESARYFVDRARMQ